MVSHAEFSASVQNYALELVKKASNNSKQASPEQLAKVLSDIAVFSVEECLRHLDV